MKPTSVDIPVHDIGPLLEIHDSSAYWFLTLITVILVVVAVTVKKMRKMEKLKETDERAQRYKSFTRIDMNNPKSAAYAMCEQGSFFAHDNEETLSTYQILFKRLEPYKYARRVEAIDEETLMLYVSYQDMIAV